MTLGPTISTFLDNISRCESFKSVIIDLCQTDGIDSTSLGMLAKISIRTQNAFDSRPTIISTNEDITRLLLNVGFEEIFIIITKAMTNEASLLELPEEIVSEVNLRDQVLEAHRVLMSLNESNRDEFQDLVAALEEERSYLVSRSLAS